jgi:hypothetical protein
MRRILIVTSFLLSYPVVELSAVPSRCPKIDSAMLKADIHDLTKGGELTMNGYNWKVVGGNLCDPNCGDRYQQTLQSGVTTSAAYTSQNGISTCTYKFKLNDNVIADLVLVTDESMKLPEHSFQRWSEVPADPEGVMEKEEEQYRDDPRIRME